MKVFRAKHIASLRVVRVVPCWLMTIVYFTASSILHAAPLTVVTEEWPPYNYLNENGEVVGQSTEFVRRVLDEAEVEYELELVTWARAYRLATTQKNVLIYTIFHSPSRQHKFNWMCPIADPVTISLFRLSNRSDIQIEKLADARQYLSGVVRGDYATEYLQKNDFLVKKHLMVFVDEETIFRQLLKGRIDLLVQSQQAVDFLLQKFDLPESTLVNVWPSIDGNYQIPCMALSLGSDPELISALRKAFMRVPVTSKLKNNLYIPGKTDSLY